MTLQESSQTRQSNCYAMRQKKSKNTRQIPSSEGEFSMKSSLMSVLRGRGFFAMKINANNQPVGQSYPNAKWTDNEVEQVRALRSDGFSFQKIAEICEMPKSTVAAICTCKIRRI